MEKRSSMSGFLPYALAAFLVGIVGGFSAVLGPAFIRDLGLPYNNTTWTALATAVSSAACAPILGKLADVFGRRRTLLLGLSAFTAGNTLSAAAPSLIVMLLARFVVGIGMAAIAPVVIAYILTEFPPERIARGFSLYMLISSASVVVGPTVGTWIIAIWGWRTMMWLCTGLCVAVLGFCLVKNRETGTGTGSLEGFDAAGAVLVVVFFGLVLCIPSFGQNFGWYSGIFSLIVVGTALSFLGLVSVEKQAKNPILPIGFIRRKLFLLPVAALFLTQGLMQANMTNTIVFVESTRPDNASISGYAISVMYIGMSLGAVLLGPLADRFEPREVLTGSLGATALGCGLMLLYTQNTPVILLILSLGILGFGLGGNGTIFMKVVLSDIPQKEAGAGTGTYGLFRDLAAPFGVAMLVPLFTNGITDGMEMGMEEAEAAVAAIRALTVVELLFVAAGIVLVRLLPKVHSRDLRKK